MTGRDSGERGLITHGPPTGLGNLLLPADVRAIIRKDFLVMRRDLRNMSQMITPLIFGLIYAFALLRNGSEIPAGRGDAPEIFMTALRSAFLYANVGISLFVGWSLLSRLAMQGFSQVRTALLDFKISSGECKQATGG